VDRDGVLRWVSEYERAWREVDLAAIATPVATKMSLTL